MPYYWAVPDADKRVERVELKGWGQEAEEEKERKENLDKISERRGGLTKIAVAEGIKDSKDCHSR